MPAYTDFIRGLILAPRAVAAPTPSGPVLARAIARRVDVAAPGLIVELGPGTGVVTRALLKEGVAPARIIAVESSEYFVRLIRRAWPTVAVHHGDAFRFEDYLLASSQVAAIVSGIPLLNFGLGVRKSFIQKALRHSRHFIQLSYGWAPPVEPWAEVSLTWHFVWQNLPPAHIWHYQNQRPVGSAE